MKHIELSADVDLQSNELQRFYAGAQCNRVLPHNDFLVSYKVPSSGKEAGCRIGIFPTVIDTVDSLLRLPDVLTLPITDKYSVNTARVVMSRTVINRGRTELGKLPGYLESIIDLSGCGVPGLQDCLQADFTNSRPEMSTDTAQARAELDRAEAAFKIGRSKFQPGQKFGVKDGIVVKQITGDSAPCIKRSFIELVASGFNIDPSILEEDIQKPDNIYVGAVTVVNAQPMVVCTGFAYPNIDRIVRNSASMNMLTYEVGGAKVHEDYGGNGLYSAVSAKIYNIISQIGEVAYIFGYTNAQNMAVMHTVGKMGRRIVTETAASVGATILPTMRRAVTDGKLVNEIVTYMGSEKLQALYGTD